MATNLVLRQQRRQQQQHQPTTTRKPTEPDDDLELRCLESWHDESGEHLNDNCYQELVDPSNSNGWSADDMFRYNEIKHKIMSSYNEKTLAKNYTTPLPKTSKQSKTTAQLAAKLAKEIEDKVIAEGRITPESSDDDELFEAERERSISFQQLMDQLNNLKGHRATSAATSAAAEKDRRHHQHDHHQNNNSVNSIADQVISVLSSKKSKPASKPASTNSSSTGTQSNGWKASGAASASASGEDAEDEQEEEENNMIKENDIMHKILSSYNKKMNKSSTPIKHKPKSPPPKSSNSTTNTNTKKTTAQMAAKLVREIEEDKAIIDSRASKPSNQSSSDNNVMDQLFGGTEQASFNQLMSKLKNLNGHQRPTNSQQPPQDNHNHHQFPSNTNHHHQATSTATANNSVPSCRNTKSSSQYTNSSATPATASLSSSPTLNDSASFKPVTSSSRNILRTCLT